MRRFGLNGWLFYLCLAIAGLGMTESSNAQFYINEIAIDLPGTDNGFEFFEIKSQSGGAISLSGHSLLMIEGDGTTATGTIDKVLSLDGFSTNDNGIFLWRDSFANTLPSVPDSISVHTLDFNPDIENGSITFMLVKDFTGTLGADLDSTNAGVFDSTPWSSVVDAVGLIENDGINNRSYASIVGGKDLGAFSFNADYIARDAITNEWIAADLISVNGELTIDPNEFEHSGGYDASQLNFLTVNPGTANFSAVPEPGSMLLLGCVGIVGGAWRRLRKPKA